MQKTSAKFQNNRWKTVRGVAPTRYPLSIHFDSISNRKKTKFTKQKKWEKNNQRIISKPLAHLHSMNAENIWKDSKQSVENCKRCCAHKVPSIISSERSTELEDSISLLKIYICLQEYVTLKWLIWSGRNTNSSEILCLYWLRASLMKIWSKMNELAWGNHFPTVILGNFSDAQGHLTL